ncbi:MAG: response regulator [Patescibacteria group bacterium]|jgi:DNA-binding response OmpR family regulator
MDLSSKTLLLVDDDLTLREMYEERLKAEGFTIVQASNGEEALAKAKEIKPAIILLDIMMPKVNGFDVLKSLKANPDLKEIPVIVLSALIQDVDRAEGKRLGAADYIVKSETMPGEVIEKIKAALVHK